MSEALSIENLVAGYGPPAPAAGGFTLRVPRLTLAAGESLALMGPSGCGKTTLLHAAAGVLPVREGSVRAAGAEVARQGASTGEAARRRLRLTRVGLVLQELELLEHLNVRDNVLLAWHLGARPCPWSEAPARARALCRALGIEAHLARRPRALSQGERQRVAVARALAPEPSLILADEPTGNLDADSAARVVDLLLAAVRERGAALLLVTHDVALARRLDRTLELPRLAEARR